GKPHPFAELNREFAYVIAGGGDCVLWETTDDKGQREVRHRNPVTFHRRLAHRKTQVGKRELPLTQEWMQWPGRRSYDGIVFRPQQPTPDRFYNLWRGFTVAPVADASADARAGFDMF